MNLRRAETAEDFAAASSLIAEYVEWLGFDLSFQDFKYEIENLEKMYSPPEGALLLAESEGTLAGCAALRRFSEDVCEMKRMFVREEFRGKRIGRALALKIIEIAREAGYKFIRLDTLAKMEAARKLYLSLGFKVVSPYRYNPLKGAVFMELKLK